VGTAQGGVGLMFFQNLWHWFTNPAHWHGMEGIPNRMYEHIQLSVFTVGAAAVIAIPLGIFFGHRRRGAFLASSVINIGRAMPSFAIIALALPVTISLGLGLGFWPSWLALFVLAMPPMFTNALTAVQQVDRDVIESARGMGMRPRRILLGVELPLALPLIVAGVRTATVQVVATAPLAALVAWGGLGRFIIDGLATRDYPQVAGGAILVALLSIATELALGFVERILTPGGSRRRRATRYGPASPGEETANPLVAL
jgi:osmoprotectant transport system permease protein